jgi:glycosyltransferase involved in cell wall biosynthesis
MRILSIHNRYQIRGGEDESREAEEQLLRDYGHHVEVYEENNHRVSQLGHLQVAARTVWSVESYNKVRKILQKYDYDLIHVQNFFPLISPSVYYAAQAEGVPVIQSLRNYRLLCGNGFLFREGKVCEACLNHTIPWPAIIHRCYRDSLPGTVTVSAMQVIHRALKTWTKQVNLFITLTEFSRHKFIQAGFHADKIVVKPNFIAQDSGVGTGQGGYAFYVGRLSPEKGIDTLLSAWQQLGNHIPLKIVGDGPLSQQVQQAAAEFSNIEWLGRQPLEKVYDLIGEAQFLIFPSQWYETFGRVAIEAFSKGTPVIAANIGAIAELIQDQKTGLLFTPGNPQDLTAKVQWALAHPQQIQPMRIQARSEFESKYTPEKSYQQIMAIYQRVIAQGEAIGNRQ